MSAAEHVRVWLARRLTGCRFAASLAGSARGILFSVFPGRATAEGLDAFFDAAATQHVPAIGVFPTIRSEGPLIDQLTVLAAGPRWSFSLEKPLGLVTDETLIGIRWRTSAGRSSAPMGLAPFPTMPVTRRAPHVCLAAWPGEHENPYWTRYQPDTVDFLDTRLDPAKISKSQYRTSWDRSAAETAALLADPPDSAAHYRSVAFRLGAAVRSKVAGFAISPDLAEGQR